MKLRRTMLYLPGNNPAMLTDAIIYNSDSIMIDLEDSIPVNEKDTARLLTYHALKSLDFKGIEVVVRINGLETPYGEEDIKAVVAGGVDVIRLPKTETKEDLYAVEALIEEEEKRNGLEIGTIKMMAAIESPLGVHNALDIAQASKRLIGIALGAEDYVTSLKTNRSDGGTELLYARSQILVAARIAGIYALDTVYSDVNNIEGFKEEVRYIKQLGFDGKSVIHPSQVRAVHEIFCPTESEIDYSERVLKEINKAHKEGLGVITVDGKMIDQPMIERAERVIELYKAEFRRVI